MRDLVQRLRQVGAHHWYEHDGSAFCYQCRTFAADWKNRPSTPCQPDALMTEAADEIERQNRMLETYRAECEGWQAALEKAERQRDEARALLLDIDQWFRQDGASFPDYIQGRIDAALGGRDA